MDINNATLCYLQRRIENILKRQCDRYESLAQSEALTAVKSGTPDDMATAKRTVAIHDALKATFDNVARENERIFHNIRCQLPHGEPTGEVSDKMKKAIDG